ncbi:hypothetical protein AB8B02_05775 [Tardiphaga sp. 862_B3_N4_1]|uniref:hypothetical protein n=1 Tax=Tardiphaga sp. 862_B3_N4_1 TaxID=3240764 RepID=UPI003F1F7F46
MKTPTKKPGSPLDAIYRRVDLTPEQIFQALSRLRQEAQEQIEYLIDLCDELDGDVDLEPDPAEQNLASVSQNAYHYALEAHDDAEEDDCELEDGNDDEPSLGSANPTMSGSQQQWSVANAGLDYEDEHDGGEPDDSGIADMDGYMEQVPSLFEGHHQRVVA